MNVAFIPVRGGSKSIPLKNIKPICGKPLVYWTVKAAVECKYIEKVYVATDSEEIRKVLSSFKSGYSSSTYDLIPEKGTTFQSTFGDCSSDKVDSADQTNGFDKLEIIGRSAESASDTASTESAMLEFADKYDFDNIVLIQATSPLLTSSDLDRGFEAFAGEDTDSVLSVVRQKRFNWTYDKDGFAHPTNYDYLKRPRRQEFDGYLVENGAFYITSKSSLVKTSCRISGNIKAVEMDEDSFFEIDEISDWVIIEKLLERRLSGAAANNSMPQSPQSDGKNSFECDTLRSTCSRQTTADRHDILNPFDDPTVIDKARNIKLFLTDCDGCLTDGGMYYSEHGDELKKFNTKDGMGFGLLREHGILTGIITAESVELNKRRATKLKLDILETGCRDKASAIRKICEERNINIENVCYIGDDLFDVKAIKMVGLGCAPNDASEAAKKAASLITNAKGGSGVTREVADFILKSMEMEICP